MAQTTPTATAPSQPATQPVQPAPELAELATEATAEPTAESHARVAPADSPPSQLTSSAAEPDNRPSPEALAWGALAEQGAKKATARQGEGPGQDARDIRVQDGHAQEQQLAGAGLEQRSIDSAGRQAQRAQRRAERAQRRAERAQRQAERGARRAQRAQEQEQLVGELLTQVAHVDRPAQAERPSTLTRQRKHEQAAARASRQYDRNMRVARQAAPAARGAALAAARQAQSRRVAKLQAARRAAVRSDLAQRAAAPRAA